METWGPADKLDEGLGVKKEGRDRAEPGSAADPKPGADPLLTAAGSELGFWALIASVA
jgi:hypothetical protein